MKTIEVTTYSDDGTHERAKNCLKVIDGIHKAAEKFGKGMDTVKGWKEKMEKVGFENVKWEEYKVCNPHRTLDPNHDWERPANLKFNSV